MLRRNAFQAGQSYGVEGCFWQRASPRGAGERSSVVQNHIERTLPVAIDIDAHIMKAGRLENTREISCHFDRACLWQHPLTVKMRSKPGKPSALISSSPRSTIFTF